MSAADIPVRGFKLTCIDLSGSCLVPLKTMPEKGAGLGDLSDSGRGVSMAGTNQSAKKGIYSAKI
jgi:hypothetical protein